jgi:putative addiction module CopG family antidote
LGSTSAKLLVAISNHVFYNKALFMTITLNPELDRLVREKLVSGRYESIEEVLTAALRALNAEEEAVAAIAEGIDDIESGRF